MPENTEAGYLITVEGSDGAPVLASEVDLINNFNFLVDTYLIELPYSTIYSGNTFHNYESIATVNNSEDFLSAGFVFATNVHHTVDTLPAFGVQTYNLIRDLGLESTLDESSYLEVDFESGSMLVDLNFFGFEHASGAGTISDFYNTAIMLNGPTYNGSISGRFIGANAEGALTFYNLADSYSKISEAAIFDSTGINFGSPQNPAP